MLIVVIDSYRYNEIETDPLARARETNASHSLYFRSRNSWKSFSRVFQIFNFSTSRLLKLILKQAVYIYFRGVPMNFLVDVRRKRWTILCIIIHYARKQS